MVNGSGFFELEIVDLHNPTGRLASGRCCGSASWPVLPAADSLEQQLDSNGSGSGSTAVDAAAAAATAACRARECATYFRLCLKEYQSNVTVSSPCTYGQSSSPVLGGNSFTFVEPQRAHARLVLPFTFRWTVSLSYNLYLL